MKKKQMIQVGALLGVIALIVAGIFGYMYWNNHQKSSNQVINATKKGEAANNSTEKTDNSSTSTDTTPVQTKPSTTTTTTPAALANLTDVSLTVYVTTQDSKATDGNTNMPTGSLTPFFYMPAGTYTIQKMASGAWQDVITNQSYPGHGGVAAWFAGPSEDNIQYRVLKIQNGQPTSASKTFVVKRSDLSGGVYTYN